MFIVFNLKASFFLDRFSIFKKKPVPKKYFLFNLNYLRLSIFKIDNYNQVLLNHQLHYNKGINST